MHSAAAAGSTSRALRRACALSVVIGLSAGLMACVELPGIYYNVFVEDAPSDSECVKLTDALAQKLNLQLQPSPYQCSVVLDTGGSTPARSVAIVTYVRRRRIQVEINELRSGSPIAPSPSTQQFAQQVMQIVHDEFPGALLVRFKAHRGPIAP